MKNNKTKWIAVAAVAALVASVVTVLIFVLRARAKKKARLEDNNDFGYDLEEDYDNWELIDAVDPDTDENEEA